MKSEELNQWRTYFRSSNSDIFSIIEHAIVVAANDCPNEFKARRDRIAERLFSVMLNRCKDCEKVGVAVSDNENGEVCKRGSSGREGASKESSRDDNGVMVVNPISNYSFDEAEALTDQLDAEAQLVAEILRIKDILENKDDESESVLFDSLRRLQLMQLSMHVLEATGIGMAVTPLRKHRSQKIRDLAKIIISAWKVIVRTWVKENDKAIAEEEEHKGEEGPGEEARGEGTPDSLNPSVVVNGQEDEEEGGLPSPPLDEGAFFVTPAGTMELSQFFDGMDDDGNIRKSAPTNKNRGNGRKPALDNSQIKDKRNLPESNEIAIIVKDNKSQQLKKKNEAAVRLNKPVAADSGPRRPLTSSIHRNSNVEPKMKQKLESSTVPKRPLNAQQDRPKCSDDVAKLEATKRRLQESYQQAENAKRQRTIQVMEINELPKQGAGHRNTHFKPGNHNRQQQRGHVRR